MTFGCQKMELREGTNNSCKRLYSPGAKCMVFEVKQTLVPIPGTAPSFRQVTLLRLSHTGERKTDPTKVVTRPKRDDGDQAPGG